VTALVFASEDIELDAEPEEGLQAVRAQVLQRVEEAEKRLRQAEKEAEQASEAAEEKRRALEASRASGTKPERQHKAAAELRQAEEEAERASRKAAKARAKKLAAEKELEDFDATAAGEDKEPKSG
jgi:hypothetical protein